MGTRPPTYTMPARRGERSELASSASGPKGGGAYRATTPAMPCATGRMTAAERVSA